VRAPVVLALLLAAPVAGCGGADRPTPEQQVRTVLTTFATAAERRDYQTICTRVLAPHLLAGLRQISLPCEVALQTSLGRVKDPRLTVGAVTVDGPRATAQVRTSAAGQQPSSDTVRLDRIKGAWKVSDLSDSSAAAATPAPGAGGGDG
jgi:hypothetical protein